MFGGRFSFTCLSPKLLVSIFWSTNKLLIYGIIRWKNKIVCVVLKHWLQGSETVFEKLLKLTLTVFE